MSKKRNSIRIIICTVISFLFLMGSMALGISSVFNAFNHTLGIVEKEKLRENSLHISTETFTITNETSTDDIANALYKKGFITDPTYFKIEAKLYGVSSYIPGEYEISSNMSSESIFKKLTTPIANEDNIIKFTIPEGFTITQIAEILEAKEIVTKEEFLKAAQDKNYSKSYPFLKDVYEIDNLKYKLEGYLFPDTYTVSKSVSSEEIIIMMLNRFQDIVSTYTGYINNSNYNMHEILTIASIIEQEAKVSKERPIISGVIHNRLLQDMNLQMCSTIQYSLEQRKTNLTYDDLEIDTPYNTYKYSGLPIGPISSPGEDSIKAACLPESHDYLFFVLEDETAGTHFFSTTLNDHSEAKNRYNQSNDINFVE